MRLCVVALLWAIALGVEGAAAQRPRRSKRGGKREFDWAPPTPPGLDPTEKRAAILNKLESMGGLVSSDPKLGAEKFLDKNKGDNGWGETIDAADTVVEAKPRRSKSSRSSKPKAAAVEGEGGVAPFPTTRVTVDGRPMVLVVAVGGWWGPARFAKAMVQGGLQVSVVTSANNAFRHTKYVRKEHVIVVEKRELEADYGLLLDRLLEGIQRFRPDFVLPIDDQAVGLVRQSYRFIKECLPETSRQVTGLLYRSLGTPKYWEASHTKIGVQRFARDLQPPVRAPKRQDLVPDGREGSVALERMGAPVVVKASMGSGGSGVRICHTAQEATNALSELHRQVVQEKKASRASRSSTTAQLCSHRAAYLRRPPYSLDSTYGVSLEQYVPGETINYHFMAWRGVILNGMLVSKVERVDNRTSKPSTVQKVEPDDADVHEMTARMVKAMGYSGPAFSEWQRFDGPGGDGKAYLIEMNPRPGPNDAFSHLLGQNRWFNLAEALKAERAKASVASLQAQLEKDAAPVLEARFGAGGLRGGSLLTLFPEEVMRAGASAYHRAGGEPPAVTDFWEEDPRLLCYIHKKVAQMGRSGREKTIDPALHGAIVEAHRLHVQAPAGEPSKLDTLLRTQCPKYRCA